MSSTQKSVLLVLTSHDELGSTGSKTGVWLEELASAYWTFLDGGCRVELASVRGGAAPLDPVSREAPWSGPASQRFTSDASAMSSLAATKALEHIDPAKFDAIYLVGGAGAAYDFPNQGTLGKLVSSVFARGAPVAAVCHGVLGLVGAKDQSGAHLVSRRQVTGVSNEEEVTIQYDKILPLLPEPTLTNLGGIYSATQPFGEHVVRDKNLITGQNPASAAPLAREVLKSLGGN